MFDEEPDDGMDALTMAYANGRSDQFEDDCAIVKALLEECDDAVEIGDGRLNVTRIREMLEAHFTPGQCFPDACKTPSECDSMGCKKAGAQGGSQ